MNIPSREECLQILSRNKTPENVVAHSKTVCKISEAIIKRLEENNIEVNKELVVAAALLHDVERIKENHVVVGARFIADMGYPEVGEVMSKHSLYQIDQDKAQPQSVEDKIVFYADKRARNDVVVTIEERFADLKQRYNLDHLDKEFEFTKKIEEELLGGNPNLDIE